MSMTDRHEQVSCVNNRNHVQSAFVLLVSVESSDAGVETKYDRLDNSF